MSEALLVRSKRSQGSGGDSNGTLIIERYCGSTWTYNYYSFLERYHRDPIDFDDYLDGIDVMMAKSKLEEYYMNKER